MISTCHIGNFTPSLRRPRASPARPLVIAVALACSFLLALAPARAATISVAKQVRDGAVVTIDGEFTLEDGERFAVLVAPFPRAAIIFNSPGGNLLAGLRIGEIAQSRGFATIVPNDALCASACAVAWLGGAHRYLGATAHLGFHAAFLTQNGTDSVSSSGNALLGAYFDRLGLSYEAIYALTQSGPADILWLDVASANDLGIATQSFQVDDATPPAPTFVPTDAGSARGRATQEVRAYFAAGSSDANSAVSWLRQNYAATVSYYGKATARDAVLREKRAFVARWPERLYIPDSEIEVHCSNDGSVCQATGTVAFECRSHTRVAYSAGSARYNLTLNMSHEKPSIIGEDSRVIDRR